MLTLPAAARVACWLNAWLAGRESADDVISGLSEDVSAEFVGPEAGSRLSPAALLGSLRQWGVHRVTAALPVPGDPLGLGGPPAFNSDAIDASEGALLHGADLGMVPTHTSTVTSWQLGPAIPPTHLPFVADADRRLRAALSEAADSLAALDVASWRPEVADALIELRKPSGSVQRIPFAAPICARLASDSLRAAGIVEIARADDGGAVSAVEAQQRAAALVPLDRAARAGLVAASSSYDGT